MERMSRDSVNHPCCHEKVDTCKAYLPWFPREVVNPNISVYVRYLCWDTLGCDKQRYLCSFAASDEDYNMTFATCQVFFRPINKKSQNCSACRMVARPPIAEKRPATSLQGR